MYDQQQEDGKRRGFHFEVLSVSGKRKQDNMKNDSFV